MASLPATLGLLEQNLARIHLLKFTHGSVMRDPQLRTAAGGWWEQERKEGEWGREDENVQNMADKLGFGYVDRVVNGNGEATSGQGKLKSSARTAVEALKNGFKPGEGL